MKRENIETIIRDLFRDDYRADPDRLTGDKAREVAIADAGLYWYYRDENEIARDEKAGVTKEDYINWSLAELAEQQKQTVN